MRSTPISGGASVSRVILIGQAPGVKEPVLGQPFAWTAGKTLFRWFEEAAGVPEIKFRREVYMAAVCRCFPGKSRQGGDRVPAQQEILNCSVWMQEEFGILKPGLVIPVGKLAIAQFIWPVPPLVELIGTIHTVCKWGCQFDLVPLPHPSGASPWHRIEPGKSLLREALRVIIEHPAWLRRVSRGSDIPGTAS